MTGRIVWALTTALIATAGPGLAQEESNRVAAETDWAVFQGAEPKECWAVTAPKETVNTRDGRVVSVRRGDILLFVTYRPEQNISGEVSFTASPTTMRMGTRMGSTAETSTMSTMRLTSSMFSS